MHVTAGISRLFQASEGVYTRGIMDKRRSSGLAERLRGLHHGGKILVLVNVWDVAGARLLEQMEMPAVATSSAAIASMLGYVDGERISRDEMLEIVQRIADGVELPVTADLEAGYAKTPEGAATTVSALLETGAVGMNLEDGEGEKRLADLALQVEKIRAVKEAGRAAGVDIVLNARSDAYLLPEGEASWRFKEAVRRATAFREAGADCVFLPGLGDAGMIKRFLKESPGPLNILISKGGLPTGNLERLGVARASYGSGPARAALATFRRIVEEVRTVGTCRAMTEDLFSYDEIQALMGRK
jgi:2-methylisocitrate lyase-like PEP mutase family enzyme